jgi:hypothetical protein
MTSGTTNNLYGVWGADAYNVFAVGATGTILRWNGTAWAPLTSGTTLRLYAVSGSAANNVFAVGEIGTALRWNGSTWSPTTTGTLTVKRGVLGSTAAAITDNDVFRVLNCVIFGDETPSLLITMMIKDLPEDPNTDLT